MAGKQKAATAAKPKVTSEAKEVAEEKEVNTPIIPKDIDQNMIITVKNGFNGKLVYVSPRTHEQFVWNEFGDEQELELKELRNIKSSAKGFFENNWLMFDDEFVWAVGYLGLERYYKNAVKLSDFDKIFDMSPEDISDVIANMSEGQKRSLSYRAKQFVAEGKIDSRKIIAALEKALGMELIER